MVALSSLDVHVLAQELARVEDAVVDKVYQTGRDEYRLKLRKPRQGASHLLLRLGAFAALSPEAEDAPESPSQHAMALRKTLTGARLRRVEQHEFDRVLKFHLDVHGDPHTLVVELFGRGNLLLADAKQRLLFVHRAEAFAHRTLRRGETLKFPPPRVNPKILPRAEFDHLAASSARDLVRFLALDLGLGGELSEEVMHRAGLDKARPAKALPEADRERLWTALQQLLRSAARPGVARRDGTSRPASLPFEGEAFDETATLSDAILRVAEEERLGAPPPTDEERDRLDRQLRHQEEALVRLEQEADAWERRGHLVYERYEEVQRLLSALRSVWEREGPRGALRRLKAGRPEDAPWAAHVVRIDEANQRAFARIQNEEIPLDPRATVEKNAALSYDEAKRLRAKLDGAQTAVAETRRRLRDHRSPAAAPARAPRAPKKRFWFESFRWFYTSEGLLVVGGRDAASNEKLVKRHLKPGDLYVHADFHGAPSCILKTERDRPGPESLREACQFAATYSRAFARFASADAYWVQPEQVSKTPESGEYVPKGAFIVRGHRNHTSKLPLEAAVGLVRLNAEGRLGGPEAPHARLMGGPESALRARPARYVLVRRGTLKASDAAKQLAPLFGVTVDEAQGVLPPGPISITPPQGGTT